MNAHPDPPTLSFPHATRRDELRHRVAAEGLDFLLVTDLVNIRYLTGFTGSNAALLVAAEGEDATVICTDFRYAEQVRAEAPDMRVAIDRPVDLPLLRDVPDRSRVGYENEHVTVAAYAAMRDAAAHAELTGVQQLVETLRVIKDPEEVRALQAACEIADAALDVMIATERFRPGHTERELALELDERMRRMGSQDVSFPTILAAGEHSSIPHHQPTDRPLAAGDLLKIDFGAVVGGYHSDMTRTMVLGPPADWQSELHALVTAAQQAGRDAATPGAALADVDAAAREVIVAAGHGEHFGHGLGHGVGLEVHEAPWFASSAAGIMKRDMTVTVEPGVYLPGRGGVRIEDCGVVTPAGFVPLTLTPRDLVVL